MSIIIYLIMGITIVVSIIAFNNRELFYKLSFNPHAIEENKEWYRFFTHAVVHGDWMHLIFNMYVFYGFSGYVLNEFTYYFESKGILYFLLLYVGGVAFSSIKDYVSHRMDPMYNAIGASGGVASILFAFIVISPTSKLSLMFLPIPVPAYIMGILYIVVSAYMAKRGNDNIGHNAHLWGSLYGLVFTMAIRPAFFIEFFEKLGLI